MARVYVLLFVVSCLVFNTESLKELPPNYAKCVAVLNSTPEPIKVTVTYKLEGSTESEEEDIDAWDAHMFKEKTQRRGSYHAVLPVRRIRVEQRKHGSAVHTVEVEGVHTCVEREVTLTDQGLLIAEKTDKKKKRVDNDNNAAGAIGNTVLLSSLITMFSMLLWH